MSLVSPQLLASFIVSGVLEISVPLFLGFVFRRRLGVSWRTYAVGCAMFAVSLIRMPLNSAVSQVIGRTLSGGPMWFLLLAFPSFTAGLFEESARFAAFRLLIKDRSWENGVMYGAGHGGIESMLLAGVNVLGFVFALIFFPLTLPLGKLQIIEALPVHMPLVGLYERLMAITIQIGLSVLVLQCFIHNNFIYLCDAIFLHFSIDFTALATARYGILWPEVAATFFAIAFYLYIRYTAPPSYN